MAARDENAPASLWIALTAVALLHADWAKFLLPPAALYAVDYGVRGAAIVLVLAVLPACRRELALSPADVLVGAVFFLALVQTEKIAEVALALLGPHPLFPARAAFPPIGEPVWRAIDLTAGLALVAISEEIVYRRVVRDAVERRCARPIATVGGPSLLFAALHTPQGPEATLVAFLAGLALIGGISPARSAGRADGGALPVRSLELFELMTEVSIRHARSRHSLPL